MSKYLRKLFIDFKEVTHFVAALISEHTDMQNNWLEKAENHRKGAENFRNILGQEKLLKNY